MTRARSNTVPNIVLFDLDGTLADTLPDLRFALAQTLPKADPARLSGEALSALVSRGTNAMIRFALGHEPSAQDLNGYRKRFLQTYYDNIARQTRLYPHIDRLLDALQAQGVPWGVVTNKPERLTLALLTALDLKDRAACIVGGDTVARAKPHADPLLHACKTLKVPPKECMYLGDARTDIEAGREAGMGTLVALWGYIGPDEDPATWGADALLQAPPDLLTLL